MLLAKRALLDDTTASHSNKADVVNLAGEKHISSALQLKIFIDVTLKHALNDVFALCIARSWGGWVGGWTLYVTLTKIL